MTSAELALLVPLALQFGTLLRAYSLQRSAEAAGDDERMVLGQALWRRHLAVTVVFFAAAVAAFQWRAVDGYALAFAVMFVIAEAADASLHAGNGGLRGPLNGLALRASLVALAGFVAVTAIEILAG